MALEASVYRALADGSRFQILEELRAQGPLDSRQLGRILGLHPNTIRSHADQLIEVGLARATTAPSSGRGRPRVLYEAVLDARPAHDGGYRMLAHILASYLATTDRPRSVAESAGRAWGRYLAEKPPPFASLSVDESIRKVLDLFGELGFSPEAVSDGGDTTIRLHRCPFREVAEANSGVVCAVHLGMLKGALAEMGAPLEATRLEPFVEPTLCLAHLKKSAPCAPGSARMPLGG